MIEIEGKGAVLKSGEHPRKIESNRDGSQISTRLNVECSRNFGDHSGFCPLEATKSAD
jgi:hypothetical protein